MKKYKVIYNLTIEDESIYSQEEVILSNDNIDDVIKQCMKGGLKQFREQVSIDVSVEPISFNDDSVGVGELGKNSLMSH